MHNFRTRMVADQRFVSTLAHVRTTRKPLAVFFFSAESHLLAYVLQE
jgi:hypothetical protein